MSQKPLPGVVVIDDPKFATSNKEEVQESIMLLLKSIDQKLERIRIFLAYSP